MPHTQKQLLASSGLGSSYAWYAFPILIASFGFHIVIPTIRNYFKNDKKLKQTVIIGSIVPLILYIVWVFVTLGVIPLMGAYGFNEIIHQGVSLGQAYQNLLQTRMITGLIVAFTNIAVIASFLGVNLALFHFNQDAYKFKKNQSKRIINFLITFAPPPFFLIFSVFFINGFLQALGYASIFVCILLIILPALMAWSLRKKEGRNTLTSKVVLSLLALFGLFVILLRILTNFNLLAVIS